MRRLQHHVQRRGIVPIEIALVFPLMVFLFGFVFVMSSACLTRCDTSTQARHQSFRARHTPWIPDPLEKFQIESSTVAGMELPAQMLGPNPLQYQNHPPQASIATCKAEQSVDPIMEIYETFISKSKFKECALGGIWDYREMPFESTGDHPPLKMTEKTTYLGFQGDTIAFTSLAKFGGGASPHSGDTSQQQAANDQALRTAKSELAAARNEEDRLTNEVNNLQSQPNADPNEIKQLRERLAAVREGIENLTNAIRWLN